MKLARCLARVIRGPARLTIASLVAASPVVAQAGSAAKIVAEPVSLKLQAGDSAAIKLNTMPRMPRSSR